MKVAFCGASGTGKTTLARYVSELLSIPVTPVGSRSVALELGFTSPYDVDRASLATYQDYKRYGESQAPKWANEAMIAWADGDREGGSCRPIFQQKLQDEKIRWEASVPDFVSDRSSLDDCAYAIVHAPEVATAAFIKRALSHARELDFLFVCPLSSFQNLGDDPTRVTDADYHVRYEVILMGLLAQTYDRRVFTRLKRIVLIDAKERDERITAVRQVVGPI